MKSKILLKFEKTILFTIQTTMLALIFAIFFFFMSISLPHLKSINRSSIVSYVVFFIAIVNLLKIFCDVKVDNENTSEVKNSFILTTVVTDIITFLVTFFMVI